MPPSDQTLQQQMNGISASLELHHQFISRCFVSLHRGSSRLFTMIPGNLRRLVLQHTSLYVVKDMYSASRCRAPRSLLLATQFLSFTSRPHGSHINQTCTLYEAASLMTFEDWRHLLNKDARAERFDIGKKLTT